VPLIPDQLESLGRLHAHALATDPDGFVVAERERGSKPADVVGFASSVRRGGLWFLSMLFVEPAEQGQGLGRRLLRRVLPDGEAGATATGGPVRALVTDSAQPISNGLYSTFGIVPRMPLAHLIGRPERPEALPALPPGVTVRPLSASDGSASGLPEDVHRLDRELLGFEHPDDHRFALEMGRRPHVVEDQAGRFLGYGYASPVGTIGPVAVRDAALLAPVTSHLLALVEPRGALAVWVPGGAGETFSALVRSGFRIDGFPLLLCWSRPFADFARYLPHSPGLL
jgi:GNAT superfamily N-acetyltransferase